MEKYKPGVRYAWDGTRPVELHPKTTVILFQPGVGLNRTEQSVGAPNAMRWSWAKGVRDVPDYAVLAFTVVQHYKEPEELWVSFSTSTAGPIFTCETLQELEDIRKRSGYITTTPKRFVLAEKE